MANTVRRSIKKYRIEGLRSLVDHGLDRKVFAKPWMPYSWTLSAKWCRLFRSTDLDKYQAPVDPFKIIYVDPKLIIRNTNRPKFWARRWPLFGKVEDGDWDHYDQGSNHIICEMFSNRPDYIALKRHFNNGVAWNKLDWINKKLNKIEGGEVVWHGCQSETDVIERCQRLDYIYEDIKGNGFKTQYELIKEGKLQKGFLSAMLDEVCVDIGRDGELLFVDGRHRLSMAKILQLDKIPVVILNRHSEWMKKVNSCYKTGRTVDHADVKTTLA